MINCWPLGARALVLIFASVDPVSLAQADHTWATYVNDRYGFSVCYPADLVQMQRPPDADDGRSFTNRDGAKISAWALYNTIDWKLETLRKIDSKRLTAGSGAITFEAIQNSFYVISGRKGGQVFYNRTALVGNKFSAFEVTYPAATSGIWNAIVAHVSQCFKPG